MESTNQIIKKWLFVILAIIIVGIIGGGISVANNNNEYKEVREVQETQEPHTDEDARIPIATYRLSKSRINECGKVITLNANTDAPAQKYLCKIPAGKYTAATAYDKVAAFWVVKDEIGYEDSEYPEILQYVGPQILLTAGSNDLNGHAVKEVEVIIAEDESISLYSEYDIIFNKYE